MSNKLIISAITMTIIDSVYLILNRSMFETQVFDVQHKKLSITIASAVACYIFLVFGLYYFILREKKSVFDAFLLGLVIYGVYETTNYAIFNDWKLSTVIIDTLWGGILLALTTYITYRIS